MSKIGKQIVSGLKELNRRLTNGEEIRMTRVSKCLCCDGKGCEYCENGYIHKEMKLR